MDLAPFVDMLRRDLASAAELGGDAARALAERLTGPLESAIRLALLEALSTAADEITRELAPGSVELRLRGREAGFVVTLPPAEPGPEPAGAPVDAGPPIDGDDGAMTRINFRLPDPLKSRIEDAAAREGLSVNAWLVRAATAAVRAGDPPVTRRAAHGGQRYTGWVK